MGGTISSVGSVVGEAATGMVVSGVASPFISRYQMQEDLDLTLDILHQELLKLDSAFVEARERRITNPKLLEWWAEIIADSYRGRYYHRTFKYRNSRPLMIESEGTNSPTNHAAKRRRMIKTLLFGDEEIKDLYDVLKRLKNIDITTFVQMVHAQPTRPMKSNLYMDQNILFGRDKERQQVMNFLFEPTKAGENNVSILPIVGPEGGGKTSLALHCYHDPKVEKHFTLKVYVSLTWPPHFCNFHYFCGVLKQILDECNNTYTTNSSDVNTLLVILKQNLSSEKVLLVIDDLHIWKVDCMLWNALLDCVRCGQQGSKVIFLNKTDFYERSRKIVNPEAVMPVMVDGFSEDEYMFFFNEHAFGGVDPEDYPELSKLGMETAKKMYGSIWGVKILGELLRDNLKASFWFNFLQGGSLSPLRQGKHIWPVIDAMSLLLLPKNLHLCEFDWTNYNWENGPIQRHHEVSFRELFVLGPNHFMPLINDGNNYGIQVLAYEHVYRNRRTSFMATCKPLRGKSIVFLEELD